MDEVESFIQKNTQELFIESIKLGNELEVLSLLREITKKINFEGLSNKFFEQIVL